jgi:hypothetical protein
MSIETLLETAFFAGDIENASETIERALEAYEADTHAGARVFEAVAPDEPDPAWLDDLMRRLVYFCESEGSPTPRCGGVMVALFHHGRLYGITAEHAVGWGSEALGVSPHELRERYGLGEVETALR